MTRPDPRSYGLSDLQVNRIAAELDRARPGVERVHNVVVVAMAVWLLSGLVVGWREWLRTWVVVSVFLFSLHVLLDFLSRPSGPPHYRAYIRARDEYEAWFRRTQRDYWCGLSGRSFELEVATLLSRCGRTVHRTGRPDDGGVDLVIDGVIAQCKAHRKPIGPAAVRDLCGAMHHRGASKAILISTRGFTAKARRYAEEVGIELWDSDTLIGLQRELPADGTTLKDQAG